MVNVRAARRSFSIPDEGGARVWYICENDRGNILYAPYGFTGKRFAHATGPLVNNVTLRDILSVYFILYSRRAGAKEISQ